MTEHARGTDTDLRKNHVDAVKNRAAEQRERVKKRLDTQWKNGQERFSNQRSKMRGYLGKM
jgi:hypothetical protein